MTKIKLKRTKFSLERWKMVYDSPFKKIFLKKGTFKKHDICLFTTPRSQK